MAPPAHSDWNSLRATLHLLRRDDRRSPLRQHQRRCWLAGLQPKLEQYRVELGVLLDEALFCDLIAHERAIRADLGEPSDLAEYQKRFPELAARLAAPLDHTDTHGPARDNSTPVAEQTHLPTVPGYEVQAFLDRGGQGDVFRARRLELNRVVALKILRRDADGAEQLERFRREGRFFAQFDHPHIVRVYDCTEYDSRLLLSMELLEGGSLKDRLKQQGSYAPRAAAELAATLAETVHVAHQRGVIHRDLKPGNILFTPDGHPKITDFGLAKRLDDSASITNSQAILGTARYMAPEQAAGKSKTVTPATDVWSLGTMLYETLTGRPPFDADDWLEVLIQVRREPPDPPRRAKPEISPALEAICLKCLSKEPTERYSSAAELGAVLRAYLSDSTPDMPAPPPPPAGVRIPADYQIIEELGRGFRSTVYRARRLSTGRELALKVLTGGTASDAEWHRQMQEARPVLELTHPNLVPLEAVERQVESGAVFLSLAYISGGSLYRKMAGQPQQPKAAGELVEQLARLLGTLHESGLCHRDLTPANVLLAPPPEGRQSLFEYADEAFGVPKLTDFDAVRRLGLDPATADQISAGPPTAYQAPEQDGGKNRQAGPAADVWALGVLLYELLTGRPPFRGRTIVELLEQVRSLSPVPPTRLAGKVPRALETICLRCLEKQPFRRYPDGHKLADDLKWFREGRPLSEQQHKAYDRPHQFRRKD